MKPISKRAAAIVIVPLLAFGAAGCGASVPTYTFEGEPRDSMSGDDDGYEGDPRDVECFDIEADGQTWGESDDDEDQQLGTFCRSDEPDQRGDDNEGDD